MYKRLFLNKKIRRSFINNKIGCIDEEYEDNNSPRINAIIGANEKIYYSCIICKYLVLSPHNTCRHSRCDFCLEKNKTCIICKCMSITK